jgi:hypothetical protein
MFTRIFAIAALAALATGTALADGGFYGTVTYINCDCTWAGADFVRIAPTGQAEYYDYGIRCGGNPGYTTNPDTFPPGYYDFYVHTEDCDPPIYPIRVYHGSEEQEVNLTVRGPNPDPDGGGGD